MILDLRTDAKEFRQHLDQKISAYIARAAKSPKTPKLSAIEIGYEFAQRGWLIIHFDTRPEHKRDGAWTVFKPKDLFRRPQWFKLVKTLAYFSDDEDEYGPRKPAQLITADGKKLNTAKLSEDQFTAALGTMLKTVLLQAKTDGLFEKLPQEKACQLDIEEFNGTWAWPDYDDLGKTNLI